MADDIFQTALKEAWKLGLENAKKHGGKAQPGAIGGQIMKKYPELRSRAKDFMPQAAKLVSKINGLTSSELDAEIDKLGGVEAVVRKKEKRGPEKRELPKLKGSTSKVVMRFAPGPSGPLHLGHSRAVTLNSEYCNKHKGKLILRLEDTNPEKIFPEAYDMIPEDMRWLGADISEVVIQSDRFSIYYDYAEKILGMGKGYVCTCDAEIFRNLRNSGQACPHREIRPELQLMEWNKMLDGSYAPGEAVMVVKTDLQHPNPAVRDFKAFRISDTSHPRTGNSYRVYPLMNFSVTIDDHLLGLTHVLRGTDHSTNTLLQEYLYRYFGWTPPEFIHYGLVKIPDVELSTSKIYEGIAGGKYEGWSDVRTGTLRAMAKRGFSPQAIRETWLDMGAKPVNIDFSMENLIAKNKNAVSDCNRFFFVANPVPMYISGCPDMLRGKAPKHPTEKGRGVRFTSISVEPTTKEAQIFISGSDVEDMSPGDKIALRHLCNVEITSINEDGSVNALYVGNDPSFIKQYRPLMIHWVYSGIPSVAYMPNGKRVYGILEEHAVQDSGKVVQLERFGYCRLGMPQDSSLSKLSADFPRDFVSKTLQKAWSVDRLNPNRLIRIYYAHA